MAPFWANLQPRDFDLNRPSDAFRDEWTSPSNYAFTILLLLGGDVVSRALAQLAGGRITPVAFSFGWVSYASSAINSAIGENKLMPGADTPCTVLNPDSKQTRDNNSWVLGRVMRDFEYWMGKPVEDKVNQLRDAKWEFDRGQAQNKGKDPGTIARPKHAGLVVSVWDVDADERKALATPGRDILFWSGIAVSLIQLGLSAVPFGIDGDWGVFLVTASAVILCFTTGALGQWRREKWACRLIEPDKKKTYILTRGNGAQHAIVIQGNGCGLNLEDLCSGFDNIDSPSISVFTRLAMVFLGVLWVLLLITSSALTDQAWYLIAVGGIGSLQNMFVAGYSRKPKALGLPLKYKEVIGCPRVFDTILEVERAYPKLGRCLVDTFFPGGIWEKEETKLKAIEDEAKEKWKK